MANNCVHQNFVLFKIPHPGDLDLYSTISDTSVSAQGYLGKASFDQLAIAVTPPPPTRKTLKAKINFSRNDQIHTLTKKLKPKDILSNYLPPRKPCQEFCIAAATLDGGWG